MRGEPGVLDYLNKALLHELTAVNQYWLHYRLLDNWGYKSLAKQWRKESIEESLFPMRFRRLRLRFSGIAAAPLR
jgi:bacterioferritin